MPETQTPETAWWMDYTNIITLTAWMADQCWTAEEVARAVEKPWSYEAEFKQAKAEFEADTDG